MGYTCNNWMCLNDDVYDTDKDRCVSCNRMLKEDNVKTNIIRVFSLAKLYVESHDAYDEQQIVHACTKIESIHKELSKMLDVRDILDEEGGI